MDKLDAALAYAKRGWAVIPLRGKLPAIAKAAGGCGVHDASSDSDTIREWWTKDPNANVGIACGQASKLWTLDVDGDAGEESLAELVHEHGPLPETVEQLMGNGRHLLFAFNGEAVCNSVEFQPGLDTRADGGYIVAPPSYHQASGRTYTWEVDHHPDDVELQPAPDWLLELVAEKPPKADSGGPTVDPYLAFGQSTPKSASYGKAALKAEAAAVTGAAIGSQENVLNTAALKIGQLISSGALDFNEARQTLIDAGLAMVSDPQRKPRSEREIKAKVEHGLRDGMARPRLVTKASEPETITRERRLRPLRWSELSSLPKRESLVKGVLDRGAMSVKFGATNCGKTFSSLDLACHVALGWPWFGRKVKQGPVVYIAAEGGLGIEERLTAFRYHHGIEPDAPVYVIPVAIDLCKTKRDAAELIREIKPLNPALVVIDTLSRAMAGGNENSPDDMGAFVGACDLIRQETSAHLLVIHHTGKDEGRGTRGHSLLNGAADTIIEVAKDEMSGLVTATVKKQRDRASGDVLTFKLEPVDIGMDDDEDTITSCVVVPSDEQAPQRARLTGPAKIALNLLIKAIDEAGEIPPASNHIPPDISACPVALWRGYCHTGSITASDKPDSKDKAFKRAADRLQELGFIGVWSNWVWVIRTSRTTPDKTDLSETDTNTGPDRQGHTP